MIESLIGSLLGGIFRLFPEVLKWLDKKNERSHELLMFDKQIEADKLRASQQLALADAQAASSYNLADLQAIVEATKAQATQTGVKWVDALSALVRPILALQWLIFLWPAVVLAGFLLAVQSGVPALEALRGAFGVDEKALASSIASFWLVDRSLRKLRP